MRTTHDLSLPLQAKQPPKLKCLNAECMRDHVIYDTAMRVNKQHKYPPPPIRDPIPSA